MRKIIAITGARSEYDLLVELYNRLHNDPEIDFSIVVTGSHLSEKFGLTAKYVNEDGFIIADRIYNLVDSDSRLARAVSIGNQIPGLAQTLDRIDPDLVLIAGDREEAISVTLTAAYMDIPVAHFFGGDVAKDGNIDNSVRYAASKFSHLHFPTLDQHKETLLKLGEDEWRIHVVGNPAIDRLLSVKELGMEEIGSSLGISNIPKKFFVLIQHSIITEVEYQADHIRQTLDAVVESGCFCFINFPNSDAGNQVIIDAYSEYATKYPDQFFLFKNLNRISYVNLLRNATCLLGNSSSGLLEAPSLGLPAINIGSRQRGRLHGDNVIFVDNQKDQILEAIDRVLTDEEFADRVKLKDNPYGDGRSVDKIYKVIKELEITPELVYKNITY